MIIIIVNSNFIWYLIWDTHCAKCQHMSSFSSQDNLMKQGYYYFYFTDRENGVGGGGCTESYRTLLKSHS